ncbi:MAG TPA: hypothetical protein VN641_11785 [Urbifossiella sp.]|nr:hypothetical protein [Urbifossiella sp.]
MEARRQGLRSRPLLAGLAASALFAAAGPAWAQPAPAAFPLADAAANEEAIEIYYGTAKRAPVHMPAPAAPVIQASAIEPAKEQHSAVAFTEAMHSIRDGTREVSAAAVGVLGSVGERMKQALPSRQIVLASYAMPAPPSPAIPPITVSSPAAQQPQIVVVHEPAAKTATETARGLTLSFETLAAYCVGLFGLIVAAMFWARGSRKSLVPALATVTPTVHAEAPLDPNAVHLMGKYNAGPLPESAERFEIGPTFQDAQQQKKQVQAANDVAAVEFLLQQNLELLAALNPDAAGITVQTDKEGFAMPAPA